MVYKAKASTFPGRGFSTKQKIIIFVALIKNIMSAKINVSPEFRNDSRENLASAYESGNKTIFSNLEIENLLPIKEESGKVVISARDLHRFFVCRKRFLYLDKRSHREIWIS